MKALILGLCLVSITPIFSQPVYFNHLIRTQGNEQARGVIQTDSFYYVYGTKFDTISVRNKGFLYKLDQSGALLEEKNWGNDQFEYFSPPSGGILPIDSSRIALCGAIRDTVKLGGQPIDCGFLMFTNPSGDSIVQRKFFDTISPYPFSYMGFEDIARTPDKGYILAGGIGWSLVNEIKEILLKTDSLGNQEWMKTYGSNGIQFRGYTLDVTPDSGYLVAGWKDDGYQYDGWILKTDKYGTKQWEKVLGGQYDDFINAACITPDGNIVVVLNDQFQDVGYRLTKIHVIKYTPGGNVIWSKEYYYNNSFYCNNIVALNDNSLVLSGGNYIVDSVIWKSGSLPYIYKLNSTGDSIWFRNFYYHSFYEPGYKNDHYLLDMIQTSDGGFLVCGDYRQYLPVMLPQSSWLVKLDSLGCDTPGCQYNSIERTGDRRQELEVFPNPFSEMVYVVLPEGYSGGKLVMYDVQGKKATETEVPANWGQQNFALETNLMNPGIYLLELTDQDGRVWRRKVVKPH
jgi:hypothetical protein